MSPARISRSTPAEVVKNLNRRFYPGHMFFAPEWLVLGVNNACNLHCRMCDVGTANHETKSLTICSAPDP